jgi:hypothetical protein
VTVGVRVRVGVGVRVGVRVLVGVDVGVSVGGTVPVGDGVAVGCSVAVGVGVGVSVRVGVGVPVARGTTGVNVAGGTAGGCWNSTYEAIMQQRHVNSATANPPKSRAFGFFGRELMSWSSMGA